MSKNDQFHFLTTELDLSLLSTPFKIRTNWYIIAGGPSSGKTTLINLMKVKGIKTVPERARQYMESEMAKGHSIEELREDLTSLNRAIMAFTLNHECELTAKDALILDGGLPDSLSYCRLVGLNPNEFLLDCFHHHYASVFILDQLPYQQDGVRYGDDTIAEFLHTWILKDYSALGYNPIKVPIMPPEERMTFILEKLSEQKLI